MEHNPQLYLTLPMLLMIVGVTLAASEIQEYIALEPGESITGKITEIYTSNPIDWTRRCLSDNWCVACVTTRDNHYVIIHRRGTEQEKQTLVSHAGGAIFPVNYTGNYTIVIESLLGSWNGPPAAIYYDFDTLTGLGLMAGSGISNYDALVPGKVEKAIVTDSSLNQWVDLGVLSKACMTVPDTCGPDGAAVSLWVKVFECASFYDGFLSSYHVGTTVFMFFCFSTNPKIRYYVAVKTKKFFADIPQIMDMWIHLVLNFIGPNNGEGIQAFKDGTLVSRHQSGSDGDQTIGDGRVVIGRKYPNTNNYYAHVEVGELIFFNQALSNEEVRELYNMY